MIDPPGRWKIFPPLIGIVIQAAYSCWIFQANGRTQNRRKRQDDRPVRRLHRVGRPKKHKSPKFEHPSTTGAGAVTSNVKQRSRRPDLPVDEVVGLVKFSTLVMRERGTPEIGSPAGQPPSPGSLAGRQRTLSLQTTIRARRFAERPGYIPLSALVQPNEWPGWTLPFFQQASWPVRMVPLGNRWTHGHHTGTSV